MLFPVQPADNNAIKKWDSQALPAPSAPKAVGVVSITGSYQAALDAGHSLATDGLKVTSESAGTVPADTSETLVLYHPGQVALALDVMKYLSGAVMMQVTPSIVPGTIQVDLGSSVNVTTTLPHPATSASTVPSTASSTHCAAHHGSQEVPGSRNHRADARRLDPELGQRPAGTLGPTGLLSTSLAPVGPHFGPNLRAPHLDGKPNSPVALPRQDQTPPSRPAPPARLAPAGRTGLTWR